jgi:hypothetical protein
VNAPVSRPAARSWANIARQITQRRIGWSGSSTRMCGSRQDNPPPAAHHLAPDHFHRVMGRSLSRRPRRFRGR